MRREKTLGPLGAWLRTLVFGFVAAIFSVVVFVGFDIIAGPEPQTLIGFLTFFSMNFIPYTLVIFLLMLAVDPFRSRFTLPQITLIGTIVGIASMVGDAWGMALWYHGADTAWPDFMNRLESQFSVAWYVIFALCGMGWLSLAQYLIIRGNTCSSKD